MTAAEFQRLPFLLRRAQVLAATGWSIETFRQEAAARDGQLRPAVVGRGKGRRFRKVVVAQIIGLPV